MQHTHRDIAEAFSGHRFALTYPHLADNIRWNLVGAQQLTGKAAVVAACEQSAAELTDIATTFDAFRIIEGDDSVVVETVGRYRDGDGTESVVSSCDIYDFTDTTLTAITSYNVELTS